MLHGCYILLSTEAKEPSIRLSGCCLHQRWGEGGGLNWSGCSVRVRLQPRLPHGCHRLLTIVPIFGVSTVPPPLVMPPPPP